MPAACTSAETSQQGLLLLQWGLGRTVGSYPVGIDCAPLSATGLTKLEELALKGDNAVLDSDKDGALQYLLNQLTSVEFTQVSHQMWTVWGDGLRSKTLEHVTILDSRDDMTSADINSLPPLHCPHLQTVRVSNLRIRPAVLGFLSHANLLGCARLHVSSRYMSQEGRRRAGNTIQR
jgi:hypothetical protein